MKSLIWGLLSFFVFFSLHANAENMCSSVSTSAASGSLFDSGGSSGQYSSREDCTFLIQPSGASSVTLTFSGFALESGYDYVYLYDGTSASSPQIARLSGSAAGTYTANSGAMLVRFTSDSSVTDSGFSATWSAATSSCAAQSVGDSFPRVSYSQSSGSANWAGSWVEIGESDGVSAGIARVRSDLCSSGNCLRLGVPSGSRAQTFSDLGVYREADLSGATSATLSFVYRRGVNQGNQTVVLSVSNNGGSSWTNLQSYYIDRSNTSVVSASFDISAYASSNTKIRFLASGNRAVVGMYIDDINIRYQPACEPEVQAAWYFDEYSWAAVADEVLDSGDNGYHGTAGKPITNSTDGVVCSAADLREDGVSDYVSLNGSALNGLDDFSISVWGKLDSTRGGAQALFAAASSSHINGVLMYFNSVSSLQLYFRNAIVATYSLPAINDDLWHHYVWTRSEGKHCLFMDGVSKGCQTDTYTGAISVSSNGLIVGQEQDSVGGGFAAYQDWEGLVDELMVFGGELSALSVRSIYTNQLAGSNWDGTSRICPDPPLPPDGTLPLPNADWHLDEAIWEAEPGEIKDYSANSFHGVASQSMATSSDGVVCRAADLSRDGISDYLSLDNAALDNSNDFSISVWGKLDSARSGAQAIFSAASSTHTNGVLMFFSSTSSLQLYFRDSIVASYSLSPINDDQWHHYVWTRSAGQHCLYRDGVAQGCQSSSYTGVIDVDANGLIIGQEQDALGGRFDSSQDWEGLVDEPMIFSSKLNYAQVSTLYDNQLAGKNYDGTERRCELPSPVVNYRFDSCNWSGGQDVVDSGPNGLDAYAVNGVLSTIDGQVCGLAQFDSEDDYINLADSNLVGLPAAMTAMAWIRLSSTPTELKTFISKDSNYEVHINSSRQVYWWWQDSNNVTRSFTSGSTINLGQWHHVAVTYKDGLQVMYIDGQETARQTHAGLLKTNSNALQIGQDHNVAARFFDGDVDEVKIFDVDLTAFEIESMVANEAAGRSYDGALRPCNCTEPVAVDHYAITHDESMVSCLAEEITFTAHDNTDTAVDAKDASLQISTSTGKGEWLSVVVGSGVLSNSGGGQATYQFPDNGETSVTLRFSYPDLISDPEVLNFNVTDGVSSDKGDASHAEDKNLSVSDTGLVFSIPDTQSCQSSGGVVVRAVKKSDSSASCESAVAGDQNVNFYSRYVAPATGTKSVLLSTEGGGDYSLASTAPGTPVSMSFNAQGEAEMTVQYSDAGEVELNAELTVDGKTLYGADTFVAYPAGLSLVADNGLASPETLNNTGVSGGAVWSAARPFTVRVSGQCANGDVTPNYQPSNTELGSALRIPTLSEGGSSGVMTVTAGSLSVNDSLGWLNISADFSDGVFKDEDARYSEVGVINLYARDTNYYGHSLGQASTPVGRFIPGYFKVVANTPEWDTHCSSGTFSYMNEEVDYAAAPEVAVSAFNAAGGAIKNYGKDLWKLSEKRSGRSYADVSMAVSAALVEDIDLSADTWSGSEDDYDGEATNTLGGDSILYDRVALEAPFEGLVDLSFTVADFTDADGACYRIDSDGDGDLLEEVCSGFSIENISAKEMRLGRLNVVDAYGPETESLAFPWLAEYYDGANFITNTDDSCSAWLESDVTYADVEGSLIASGLTAPSYAFAATPVTTFRVDKGDAGAMMSAPGAGNTGVVNVSVDLAAAPYFKFDWDGDGSFEEEPSANIVFGQFRSNDKVIFQRQW
ncbi:DUF6701 domain-containing protein [Neptunomonas japonica]|uniref:DUF6701 domain-containing protein n=1 Tax=Neptunomonas japonica TaxID=417574 RepID=UPI00048FDC53|nr:DUF6701 domain-containing protein [Neptunomonas japonica]